MKLDFLKGFKNAYFKYIESLSPQEKQKIEGYLYITLTLFTVSFFGFFAITPTLSTISNLDKQYKDNNLVYEALNKKLGNLQLLDFQYKEIQSDLEFIYSAIPRSAKIPYLGRQLENIAVTNNVSVAKLNFNSVEIYPNKKIDPIFSFAFVINVIGKEADVNNFIADIINFDRIIGIDRIITGKDEEDKQTALITGRAYFSDK